MITHLSLHKQIYSTKKQLSKSLFNNRPFKVKRRKERENILSVREIVTNDRCIISLFHTKLHPIARPPVRSTTTNKSASKTTIKNKIHKIYIEGKIISLNHNQNIEYEYNRSFNQKYKLFKHLNIPHSVCFF